MSNPTNDNDDIFELEQLDTPRHTQVGHWIAFCSSVSPTARQLYTLMAGFVNHHRRQQGNTTVYPSLNLLASLLGLARSDKVTPYMDELIWLRAVVKRVERTHGGMRSRNIYGVRFNPPPGSGLPEDLKEILTPHLDMLDAPNTKQRDSRMSAHAKACKEQVQHRRAQVHHRRAEAKAGRTHQGQDQTPAPDTTPTPENRGAPEQDEHAKPQVTRDPQKEGPGAPENRGPVPPNKGVEQDVGRTTRGTNKKSSSPGLLNAPEETGAGQVSDDGQAVADALSNTGWSTDTVKDALPSDAKVSGPGLERIANRCSEMSGWGLSGDEISQLLAGAPKNTPDKALLRRTATPEDARACLSSSKDLPGQREDVDRVCEHLAETVAKLGFTRPSVTPAWLRDARLMIDADYAPSEDEQGNAISKKVTEDAVIRMIDWVGQDPFWGGKGNIRSMSKLRKQFETLAAQARQEHKQRSGSGAPGGGYRPLHVKEEENRRYGSTLEMSMDYVLALDDSEYRKDSSDAETRGGHEGLTAFREQVFGPRQGWSTRVTRERLETLFARVRDAGYRLDQGGSWTSTIKDTWAQALAEEEGASPEDIQELRQKMKADQEEREQSEKRAKAEELKAKLAALDAQSAQRLEPGAA